MVATTDPKELPDKATWYLTTNLPAPGSKQASDSELEAADLAEILRLYGLRMWVEQSYKQVKHVLGWSDYQVRSDIAIRRHWQLVCCAFAFCWWAYGHLPASLEEPSETNSDLPADSAEREKRRALVSWPQTLRAVRAWLEPYIMLMRYWRAFSGMPPPSGLKALLERVFAGEGIYLYAH